MVDVHQLLLERVAAEPGPVFHHLCREIRTYAGKGVESCRIRPVDIQPGNVDPGLEPLEHRIGDDIGFSEVGGPAEAAAPGAVVVYRLRLFLAESQPHKVLDADRVGIEAEALHPAGPVPGVLHGGAVDGIVPHHLRSRIRRGLVHDVHRVRLVAGSRYAKLHRPVDEQRRLITDY